MRLVNMEFSAEAIGGEVRCKIAVKVYPIGERYFVH